MEYMNNTIETYSVTLTAEQMATVLTCLWAGHLACANPALDMGNITTEWIASAQATLVTAMVNAEDDGLDWF